MLFRLIRQVVFTGSAVSFANLGQVYYILVLQFHSVVMLGLSCFTGCAISFASLGQV